MRSYRSSVSGRFWFGVAILSLGILWTLDNLNILESEPILGWWPLLLVAFGVTKLLQKDRPPMLLAAFLWIGIGLLLLGRTQRLIPWDPWEFWPIVLIAFGGMIAWRAMQGPGGRRHTGTPPGTPPGAEGENVESPYATADDTITAVAVWAGVDRKSNSTAFRGGDFTAWMGGGEIDLRGATTVPEGATLDLFVLMGGLELRVPEDWQVVNEMFVFMGGFEDGRKSVPSTGKGILILRGACMMGGIEIKN